MIGKDELDAKLKDFRELICRETPRFFDSESFLEAISEVSSNPKAYLALRVEVYNCLDNVRFTVITGEDKEMIKSRSVKQTKPQLKKKSSNFLE